jgi:FkbM family methyltransferase
LCADDTVVDCGASEGLFGLIAAQKCKRVYLVEPLPVFVDSLRTTFSDIDNSEVIDVALSDTVGDGLISDDGIYSKVGGNLSSIPVRLSTIDDIFFRNGVEVDFIKIDVEGMEYEALLGV